MSERKKCFISDDMSSQIQLYTIECVYRLHIRTVWAPDTLFYILYCLESRTRYMRYMTPIYIIVVTCAGSTGRKNDICVSSIQKIPPGLSPL